MAPLRLIETDDTQLRTLERHVAALSGSELSVDVPDPRLRRYIETLPPSSAAELIAVLREMRRALDGAMNALESAGFTLEAYCDLDEAERSSPAWQAVRRVWEARGQGPRYLLRYSRGSRHGVSAYPTREEAVEAAIEKLETCEGYPEAIEIEGGHKLMNRAEILRLWEDRHDPG